jgi:hypothetical protein
VSALSAQTFLIASYSCGASSLSQQWGGKHKKRGGAGEQGKEFLKFENVYIEIAYFVVKQTKCFMNCNKQGLSMNVTCFALFMQFFYASQKQIQN